MTQTQTLPLPNAPVASPAAPLPTDAATRALQTGRILVVDDNELNRDMLSRRLRRQGHDVEVAIHGLDALERLSAADFDLLLLDIMMPEMNGYELLAHLRASERLRHLPVILISALDDADSVVKGIEMGADDHLPKPFNPHILHARVAACLAKKRLYDREQLYAKSMARELEIGRQIQQGFLPERLVELDGWQIAAHFQPARQVAGDFYDVFALPDSRVVLLVADVCDKGVGAALFMALFRSLTRVFALQAGDDADPDAVLRSTIPGVNDYIATTHGRANMFATIFFGVLEPETGVLRYVNAGHEAPLVVDPRGGQRRLAPTGPAAGMFAGLEFRSEHVVLEHGDLLLCFTDGVTDARGVDGALFSEERLVEMFRAPVAAAVALERIVEAVARHTGGETSFDDITLLAVSHEPYA
jgi:phosphoserine phosphatase RsbU/P